MKKILLQFLFAVVFSGCALIKSKNKCEGQSACAYPICYTSGCQVFAINYTQFPVSLMVSIEGRNLYYKKVDGEIFLLNPGEKKQIKKVRSMDLVSGHSITVKSSSFIGNYPVVADSLYVYEMPFPQGKSYFLTQGYMGTATHKENSPYSLDFDLAMGDTICAARGGHVIGKTDHNSKGCFEKKCMNFSNSIEILHSDGTIGVYAHLQKNGALVAIGDTVSQGSPIGLSGATGMANGPHLHFMVLRHKNVTESETIPTYFRTANNPKARLVEGRSYLRN